ncbi:MAG: exonuclease SbcCD subunit D [Deltaproteobacteria bacterium]|nr:exonuclease SbcCD subunit D [Deltaproteobacteria bacterium]
MRLIHFSDTHLGFAESAKVDPATGLNVREQDVYRAFSAVIDAALERKPDLVVHAGDLFHSARPSNRAIVTALLGFQRLSAAGIPLIVVAGNHSVPRVAASGSIFDALRVLPGIRSAHSGRCEVFELGDAAVHCIPHVPTEDGLRAALDALAPRADKRFNVLVMHAGVEEADGRFSLAEFNAVNLPSGAIQRMGEFDYVALGHYHRPMQVAPRVRYSGSTERLHASEAGYAKGFLEVDLAGGTTTFHRLAPREILPLPVLPCRGKTPGEVLDALRAIAASVPSVEGAIVVVRLEEIDPVAWIELWRERRDFERERLAGAFEVRWEKTFAAVRRGSGGGGPIGSLATEFAAYMKSAATEGLDRERLRALGERLIARVLEDEVPS